MKIDLRTAVIPNKLQAWAFHTGKNKKYWRVMTEGDKIFLDYPGLRANQTMLESEEKIKQHIMMADAIRDYHSDKRSDSPPKQPSKYDPAAVEYYLGADVGYIKRFFEEMKEGDLVIAAPRRQYDKVAVGRLSSPANVRDTVTLSRYPNDPFPARSIEWLGSGFTKRDLSPELAKQLENRHTVIELDRAKYGSELFSHIFSTYVSAEGTGVDVLCPGYRGKNPLETVEVQRLIAFFVALYGAREFGELHELRDLSFQQIISRYYSEEIIRDLEQEFHSPGRYRLLGAAGLLSVFMSLGFGMAVNGVWNEEQAENAQIENSGKYKDGLSPEEIQQLLESTVSSVSPEVQKEVNETAKKAKEEVGVKSSSIIEDPHRRQEASRE